MAEPEAPPYVKLICGLISSREDLLAQACQKLDALWGPIDICSEIYPFDLTAYYEPEMGKSLLRRFVAFDQPVLPDVLAEVKRKTNEIEDEFAACFPEVARRPINLDPGYITEANLVLASMKNFSHRIYLSQGVYAEVTLLYRKGHWEKLAWTFPDYGSGRYDEFLTNARHALRCWKRKEQ